MSEFLQTSIAYLKGVGPAKAELLKKELNIFNFYHLLTHYPFRYVDRTQFYKISGISADMPYIQAKGKISNIETIGRNRASRLVARFSDETGSIELVWFKGVKWIRQGLKTNEEYLVFGKPGIFNGKINIPHPQIELLSEVEKHSGSALQPVYSTTEKLSNKGLTSRGFEKILKTLTDQMGFPFSETLPIHIIQSLKLISKNEAVKNIHFPQDIHTLKKAQLRLKFEELFFVQLELLKMKLNHHQQIKGFEFPVVGNHFNDFYRNYLPFELTDAQKRVIKEIRADIGSGRQMNRLLQGDVGSGKTIVALLIMLLALDNGYQSCLMAPTEILASQHFEGIKELLEKTGLTVALLTGSTKKKDRTLLHEQLESGELNILIGTHALLEEKVRFKNLGMAIIDEQHRFGVAQRAAMWRKNTRPPHMLVMTATPIPRTLAMTFYGDLDISVIDELPPGRKPIKTIHKYDSSRLAIWGFIKEEIKKGRQAYVVYPLIKESETLDYKDLEDGYESICRDFPGYQVSMVHGKMKADVKDYEMQRFLKKETQIMVATTVIEVGVNVPNASVMIIESAERFGLSQLHQLRGRVGRGAEQSYCILVTGYKLSSDARTRMETMVKTNDGFEISEVDLKLRGPGDLIGTQQSGMLDLKIADLSKDGQVLQLARDMAKALLKADPNLLLAENLPTAMEYKRIKKGKTNWSRIS